MLEHDGMSEDLGKHLAAALLLFVVDGFVIGQGVLALVVGGATLVILLPLWLSAWHSGERAVAKRRAQLAAIYAAAAVGVIAVNRLNNTLAERRAQTLISACRQYRERSGEFPAQLSDLVPGSFPAVPRAKLTLAYGAFSYTAAPGRHQLAWTVFPPFARRIYTFEDSRSQLLD